MSTASRLGPWEACGNLIRTKREADGTGGFLVAEVPANIGDTSEKAMVMAAAPELLHELLLAHEIIRNALGLMNSAQRTDWAILNVASGNDSEGTTRFHERSAVIARATGERS